MIEDVVLMTKDSLDVLEIVMVLLNQYLDDEMMEMLDQVKILMNEILDQMMEKIDDSKK
jgi:hypothetical protein